MEKISYMTSILTFYIKAEIQQDQNFVIFKKLNTIFHKVEGQEDLTEIFPRRRNITKLRKTHS